MVTATKPAKIAMLTGGFADGPPPKVPGVEVDGVEVNGVHALGTSAFHLVADGLGPRIEFTVGRTSYAPVIEGGDELE